MKSSFLYKKIFFCFLLLSFLSFTENALSEPSAKIGVVDLDKVMNESLAGKQAKLDIEKEIIKTSQIIKQREAETKKLRDELNQQSSVLSESVRKKKEAEYRQKLRELKRFASDSEVEIKNKGDEISKRIIRDISKVVDEIGKKEKFSIIFERKGLFFYSDAVDISDKVMKLFDEKYQKKKK